MRRMLTMALAGVAMAAASPALANDPLASGNPCHDSYVTIGGQAAIACVGYYSSNLLQGKAGDATPGNILADISTLLTNTPNPPGVQDSSPGYAPGTYGGLDVSHVLDKVESLNGASSFTFSGDTVMSGLTVVGLHFGNTPDAPMNNITAFWLFNLLTPSDTITLMVNGVPNGRGSSNAQLYATTPAGSVPEPATWAMMLLGFGGVGLTLRARRRTSDRLLQIA